LPSGDTNIALTAITGSLLGLYGFSAFASLNTIGINPGIHAQRFVYSCAGHSCSPLYLPVAAFRPYLARFGHKLKGYDYETLDR
jgi:hypothetical protein